MRTVDLPRKYERICKENGYVGACMLPDGRIAAVYPLAYTGAIITMTPAGIEFGYEDRWCYHSVADALRALNRWDGTGEPDGWHRHPTSGRRREDGDPMKQYTLL